MNDYLSNKIRWLSFLATGAVVVLHSGSTPIGDVRTYVDAIQSFCSRCCLWAVPIFFVISGVLFCHSYSAKKGYGSFVAGKVRSLYVPVALWGILSEILIMPTTIYEHKLPCWQALLGSFAMIINVNAWEPRQSLHCVAHFWYVRDLFLWFLAAPILFALRKSCVGLLVMMLAGEFMLSRLGAFWIWRYEFRFLWLGLAFLSFGMLLYQSKIALVRLSRKTAGFASCGLAAFIMILWSRGGDSHAVEYVFRFSCVCLVWVLYDLFEWKSFPRYLYGIFFVYCIHAVVLRYIKGVSFVLLGKTEGVRALIYILHVLSFFLDIGIMVLTRKLVPRLFRLLSGGR